MIFIDLENIVFNSNLNFPININLLEEDEAISKYLEFFSGHVNGKYRFLKLLQYNS